MKWKSSGRKKLLLLLKISSPSARSAIRSEWCGATQSVWRRDSSRYQVSGVISTEAMNSRQRQILLVLSSICVGSMAFCISFFLVLLAEGILVGAPEGHAFFSPQEGNLFMISVLAGLIAAIFVGKNITAIR